MALIIILFTAALSIVFITKLARPKKVPNAKKAPDIVANVKYRYRRKDFFMTKAENDFFDIICRAVGDSYYVFPQVRLSSLLDHKVKYQNWEYALRYINQKSVDYVVCDKRYRRPLLIIELDDWSHNSNARRQRDANVEFILADAGVPLLRLNDARNLSTDEVTSRVWSTLGKDHH